MELTLVRRQGPQVVMLKTNAPGGMCGILSEQHSANSSGHDRLLSRILASLATQNANRVLLFGAGAAKPFRRCSA